MTEQFIADSLRTHSFCVVPTFLPIELVTALSLRIDQLDHDGRFKAAAVGPMGSTKIAPEIRRDRTRWWDPAKLTSEEQELWTRLGGLKDAINSACLLGLWDLEGHYALYPAGSFYKSHLDRFQSDDLRTVSIVLYLNGSWAREDEGCLRLWREAEGPLEILPLPGTLVCFLSDIVRHEVLPPKRTRKSFAGWFRRRSITVK